MRLEGTTLAFAAATGLAACTLLFAPAAPVAQPPPRPAGPPGSCGTAMPTLPPPPRTQAAPIVTDLGQGVTEMVGDGGNMVLLNGADGLILIDAQYATSAANNLAKIEQLTGAKPKFLVNTHFHADHTGGNAVFAQAGATIFSSENARKSLLSQATTPKVALPVVTFQDGVTFHLNGQTIRVFKAPLPAHSDGDVMIYFVEADVLHMGDLYATSCYPAVGFSQSGFIAALKRALEVAGPNTKIVPGHGDVAGRKDLEATLAMHEGARAAVEKAVKSGATLQQAITAKPLAQWTPMFAPPGSFVTDDAYVTKIYTELKQ